jgi:uncharacterized protein (TIGR02145 family)
MRHLLTSLALVATFASAGQVEVVYPYNPDGNADSVISAPDLLDFLPIFGGTFTPEEITVNGEGLSTVLEQMQSALDSLDDFVIQASTGRTWQWPMGCHGEILTKVLVEKPDLENCGGEYVVPNDKVLFLTTSGGTITAQRGAVAEAITIDPEFGGPVPIDEGVVLKNCNWSNVLISGVLIEKTPEVEIVFTDMEHVVPEGFFFKPYVVIAPFYLQTGIVDSDGYPVESGIDYGGSVIATEGMSVSGSLIVGYQAPLDLFLTPVNTEESASLGEDESDSSLGPCQGELTVSYHGYDYELVEIGDQCWFAENARYLPFVSGPDIQDAILPRAYVVGYYGSDVNAAVAAADFDVFGSMYNFIAVKEWPVCPSGWRVPFTSDFMELITFVGEDDSRKLREVGTLQNGLGTWYENSSGNCNGTDDYGFGAVAAPSLNAWDQLGYTGYYWTASPYYDGGGAIQLQFHSSNCPSSISSTSTAEAGAVRCLRNSTHNTGSSAALCGNGIVEGDEECDDGNSDPSDGCDGCQIVWACGNPVTYWDYDYATVLIGGQCWFAEDLQTTLYADGSEIPSAQGTEWLNASEGLHYNNMYNGYAVNDDRGLCPTGWHVSTVSEWHSILSDYGPYSPQNSCCGYYYDIAQHFKHPSWDGGLNTSGLSVKLNGYMNPNGTFTGGLATFGTPTYHYPNFITNNNQVIMGQTAGLAGCAIRCVQD